MNAKKKATIIICTVSLVAAIVIAALITLNAFYGIFRKGNSSEYSVRNTEALEDSPLQGKTYYFLGSSVTYGFASFGESMADFIAKRNGAVCVKEAVSGTTLADTGKDSYVRRIKNFDPEAKIDGFVCQLSTNDAKLENKGGISDSYDIEDYDVTTTYGAIEYIVCYAQSTWNCPVYFYTGSYYDNAGYAEMVETLGKIAEKHGITVIDLYSDKEFNSITDEQRKLYMNDDVHPTRAGYRDWWTPQIEKYLMKELP